ncbi:BnaC02g42330D [Brassica napus]|uniref:BnaC02g42330D protein n=1 Tax=Brassica napus TaxID=3708 RepID=A0A078I8L7_BRANA|nr:BnaC02g42330D [Brassica napus]
MEVVHSDPAHDPETRYDPRCCSCFPSFRSRSSPALGYSSWGRIRTADDNNNHGPDEPRWWKRAALKVREWSEIAAGPRWKTFIRRFNRDPRRGRDWDAGEKFQYDPLSYALNFDDDDEDEYVGLGGFRSFSTRYASVPVQSGKAPAVSPPRKEAHRVNSQGTRFRTIVRRGIDPYISREASSAAAKEELPLKKTNSSDSHLNLPVLLRLENHVKQEGDHKKSTLEMFLVTLLVGKTMKTLKTSGGLHHCDILPHKPGNTHDIRALRKDVTDLMQKLHGEDAQAIPWDSRLKWVDNVCDRLVTVTYGVNLQGHFGDTVFKLLTCVGLARTAFK